MLFSIFLAMLFEEGPNPLKSLLLLLLLFFFFESNLGVVLKAQKNYAVTQIQQNLQVILFHLPSFH